MRTLTEALDELGGSPRAVRAGQQQIAWIKEHGLAIGSSYGHAHEFLSIDPGKLRAPPRDWNFAIPFQHAGDDWDTVKLPDALAGELKAFWRWYLPVEAHLCELAQLVALFGEIHKGKLCDLPEHQADGSVRVREIHPPDHEALYQQLTSAAHGIYEHYRRLVAAGQIVWLPKRLGPPARKRTAVELLGRALIEWDDINPPAWATESAGPQGELPLEKPF